MNGLSRRIALTGLRASRGRTALLFAALTLAATLVAGAVALGVVSFSRRSADDVVNARHATIAADTRGPHARWHVDHVDLAGHGKVTIIDVASSGAGAPVPTGLDRVPGAGTVLVSPALGRLVTRNEFTPPGRVVGTLPSSYTKTPNDLVIMQGWDYADLVAHVNDSHPIASFSGGHGLDDSVGLSALVLVLFFIFGAIVSLVLAIPLCAFVAASARIGAQRRAERLAALRLVGMTGGEVRRAAALEAGMVGAPAAVVGTLVAVLCAPGLGATPNGRALALALGLPITLLAITGISALVAFVGLLRIDISPLGVVPHGSRTAGRRLLLIVLWIVAGLIVVSIAGAHSGASPVAYAVLGAAFAAAAVRRPLTRWIGGEMAARGRNLATVVSGRRLEREPQVAARGLGLLAIVFFIVACATVATGPHTAAASPSGSAAYVPPLVVDSQLTDSFSSAFGSLFNEAPEGTPGLDRARTDLARIPDVTVARVVRVRSGSESRDLLVAGPCAPTRPVVPCFPAARADVVLDASSIPACAGGPDPSDCGTAGGTRGTLELGSPPAHFSFETGNARAMARLEAFAVNGVITPRAAARLSRAGTVQLFVWAPPPARRAIAESVAAEPGLSLSKHAPARRGAFGFLALLFVLVPIASAVAIGAADRSASRRRSIAASWALGVPRATLRRASLLEVAIPLILVAVSATAGGIALGWIINEGAPAGARPWLAIAFVVGAGAFVWAAATAAIAPIVSRASAAQALRSA